MIATRLTKEQRRVQILEAVLPVVLEHGLNVTSKQLALAAQVAEGTLYKAFGNKTALLSELAKRDALADDAVGNWLAATDLHQLSLDQLIYGIVERAIEQYLVSFRLFQALGPLMQAPSAEQIAAFEAQLDPWVEALEPYRDRLTLEPRAAASMLRGHAIAASQEGAWGVPLTPDHITRIFLYGITAEARNVAVPITTG